MVLFLLVQTVTVERFGGFEQVWAGKSNLPERRRKWCDSSTGSARTTTALPTPPATPPGSAPPNP
ncbi:hypothetical protein GCM10010452_65070 [Crossiella cryophila]